MDDQLKQLNAIAGRFLNASAAPNGGITWAWALPIDQTGRQGEDNYQHPELAKHFVGRECLSIIVYEKLLGDEYRTNPEYNRQTPKVLISQIHEEARKEMSNHYFSDEDIVKYAEKYGIRLEGPNYGEEWSGKHKSSVKDAIFAAQETMLIPEIVERHRDGFKYQSDEDGNDITLTEQQVEEQWPEEYLRLMLPRTYVQNERVYNMPDPMHHWDRRDTWRQFYLVRLDNCLFYQRGSSCSSGSRLYHGLMAHTFASLETDHGKTIPTVTMAYNEHNQLVLSSIYDRFHAVGMDLTGNYHGDRDEVKRLFAERTLSVKSYFDEDKTKPLFEKNPKNYYY